MRIVKKVAPLILAIVMLLLPACGVPTTNPVPVFMKEWSGTGTKITETFTARAPWAIEWEYTCEQMDDTDVGLFVVHVYREGENFPIAAVGPAANQSGTDISYIHQSGNFYLEIISSFGSWNVKAHN